MCLDFDETGRCGHMEDVMWVVETGTSLLNGRGFSPDQAVKFRSEVAATSFRNKWAEIHCKGGTGYWHGMRVPNVRMRQESK